jgi:putative SOS response-associated peptidase YedK
MFPCPWPIPRVAVRPEAIRRLESIRGLPCIGHGNVHITSWQKVRGGRKQPYFIRPRDGGLFTFAGLWECWHDPRGEVVETCTILTTEANELMRPLHDRMPVILDAEAERLWLDPHATADSLHALLVQYPSEKMEAFAVNSWVSDPKHEGPRCLETVEA